MVDHISENEIRRYMSDPDVIRQMGGHERLLGQVCSLEEAMKEATSPAAAFRDSGTVETMLGLGKHDRAQVEEQMANSYLECMASDGAKTSCTRHRNHDRTCC